MRHYRWQKAEINRLLLRRLLDNKILEEHFQLVEESNIQPPRLLTYLKNESFPNKTIYSSFGSVEATDYKIVIQNKTHWVDFEATEV